MDHMVHNNNTIICVSEHDNFKFCWRPFANHRMQLQACAKLIIASHLYFKRVES